MLEHTHHKEHYIPKGLEIVPAVNAETFDEVTRRIRKVEPFVNWVHVDVADGSFTPNTLWHTPDDLLNLKTSLFIELHLMLDDIDTKIEQWLLPNVRRNIFHVEATKNADEIIEKCHVSDISAGISIRPDTVVHKLFPFMGKADLFQTLAVHPGISGQEFDESTLDKIALLRMRCAECIIEVDGGVSSENSGLIYEKGANIAVAGSAIFDAPDIEKAIDALKVHG